MLRGAEIVLQCLRAEGVDLVFGYPGGAIMPLYDALDGSGIKHILTRHEQGAVFAAEGVARVSGKVGVAFATSGPGATNLVTGIADAKMDSVPLVCITGQVRSALIGTDAFQETDVFGMTLSLTNWSRLVKSIEEIPAVIAEGFHWARSGRPGPVMIDIPTDMLKATMEFSGPGIGRATRGIVVCFRVRPWPPSCARIHSVWGPTRVFFILNVTRGGWAGFPPGKRQGWVP